MVAEIIHQGLDGGKKNIIQFFLRAAKVSGSVGPGSFTGEGTLTVAGGPGGGTLGGNLVAGAHDEAELSVLLVVEGPAVGVGGAQVGAVGNALALAEGGCVVHIATGISV